MLEQYFQQLQLSYLRWCNGGAQVGSRLDLQLALHPAPTAIKATLDDKDLGVALAVELLGNSAGSRAIAVQQDLCTRTTNWDCEQSTQ